MNDGELTCSAPEGRAAFSALKALAFLPGAVLLGGLVGGAAAAAQNWFAPLILFPLLVGVVLGAALFILLRATQTANRCTLIVAAVLAVLAAVLAEHYVSYRVTVGRQEANRQLQLARAAFGPDLGRPADFYGYLRQEARRGLPLFGQREARGRWAWALWGAPLTEAEYVFTLRWRPIRTPARSPMLRHALVALLALGTVLSLIRRKAP